MLDVVIRFSIRNKLIVGIFTMVLVAWGTYSLTRLPIDALPDITNNQVQIITLSPTLATQEVEQIITYPIEQAIKPIPKIIELRSISRFGLSVVTVVFEEKVDLYWARAQISERLKEAEKVIPKGLGSPELAPISTGLGEIYQYVVYPKPGYEKKYSAMQLRTIQDWIIRPQLVGTKGVAEVNTLGGFLKQYEIAVEPDKLRSMNTTITEIFEALEKNNENTGGAYIDKKPYAYFIRGIGMVNNKEDIKKIVVKNQNGIPILIRDVATVNEGSSIRYGAVTKDGKGEEVSGVVMMLKGENSAEVVTRVKEKIEQIKKSLPKGVDIKAYIDRSKLVEKAILTVEKNLLEGALIVIFILVLLIGNLRAGLIVASVIPLALLFAVSMMNLFGVSGNLMSLGAIDFGLIVDGAVIIVEAIVHRLHSLNKGRLSSEEMDEEVYQASSKIRSSAAFGEIIILIVYLPILALVGIEGKMFGPMAQTVSFAIIGAFILSLTYVPMMSALFLKKQTGHKTTISDKIMQAITKVYQPFLQGALKIKTIVISVSVLLMVLAVLMFTRMGGEFIPTLEEGDIATHLIIASGSSLSQEVEATTKAEKILKEKFPEIEMVVSKIGSAEIPTDPMPMEASDVVIILKDKSEWTSAHTREELMEKMDKALQDIPGITTEFSQPIQMRFNELMTGVRSDVAVKIYGDDLYLLVSKGEEVLSVIQKINGVTDARAERIAGLPQITIDYNKDKLALYGLNVGDINKVVRAGFAGETAGVVYEGEKRFDMVVRIKNENRQDINDLKTLYVTLPSGNQVPLEQIADISEKPGPMQISRENGKRRIVVSFNVRGRDIKTVVAEVKKNIEKKVEMPTGYYTEYGGQFKNFEEAGKRLSIAVPVALLLIFILLFFTFHSLKQSLLIFTAIPFSAIGGVFALWLRDMPFSISAGVGFIALFGVAVLNGIVLIGYFNQLKNEGMTDIMERIKEGTKVRLRPVVMTAAVASLGFLPMALSNNAGAEVQKPLATVVIGGLVSATLLTLIVLPVLYFLFEGGLKKIKPVVPVVLMVLFTSAVKAQAPQMLTLQQALDAGNKNQQMQAGDLDVKMKQQLRRTSFEMPKTSVTGLFGQYNTKQFDQNYTITQSIANPVQSAAKKQLLDAQIKNSEINLSATRQEINFNIRQSWNTLLYYTALNRSLKKQDSLLQDFVKVADLKFRTGESNQLEKTTADMQLQELRQKTMQNEAMIAAEKIKLRAWTNNPGDFVPADEKFELLNMTTISDTALLRQNPTLLYALQQVELASAGKKVEKTALLPDFTAGYFIQSLTGPQEVNGQTVYYNGSPRFQGFSVGLSLPVFARGSVSKIKAAELNKQLQEKNAAYVEDQLAAQWEQEIQQLKAWQASAGYYTTTALPNAALMIDHAKKAYAGGDIGYSEYLQAMLTARQTTASYLNAVYEYNRSVINLQYLFNQ